MFDTIYVPVDNSEYSNRAIDVGVSIGEKFGSKMVGSHVYAAAMHDYRFKQMEFTLPSEYLQEEEIERQRKIHDNLITMGLELISDCYLNEMDQKCKAVELPLERRMMDGKHHVEIVRDMNEQDYDLVVMGALGVGKTKDSQIGSVCERVVRHASKDVLVVKHLPKESEFERDHILVGVDGSPQSFGALVSGIELAKKFDKRLEVISVYDPYLHYAVFNSIVDVLTDKAAKVFRFEEQNQLHEEVIDTGLAQIYQSHLNVAESMAGEHGVEVKKTLLDGKAFQKILQHARKDPPWLLIIGRIGVHKLKEESSTLGSTTENLLRLAPCDVLLSTRTEHPSLDRRAEESILWTEQAEQRMTRVPDLVKGIARTGVLRLAIEEGHSVITESVIEEAMERFMPKHTQKATNQLAEAIAIERARDGRICMCKNCGVTAAAENAKQCSVCGGREFETIDSEMLERIAESQGGLEEEQTYDGKKLRWSLEAREKLLSIEDKYQKRRAKARIEKAARVKRLDVVTAEFAEQVIEEDIGRELPFQVDSSNGNTQQVEAETADTPEVQPFDHVRPLTSYDQSEDLKLIARDADGNEIRSAFAWTDEAVTRLLRIPSGFMRSKTQERIEGIALERQSVVVDIDIVNAGLEVGRKIMEEVVKNSGLLGDPEPAPTGSTAPPAKGAESGKCPFSSMFSDSDPKDLGKAYEKVRETYQVEEAESQPKKTISHVYTGAVDDVLNESGVMHMMSQRRKELKSH